ncbi:hypothetical protein H6F67_18800 [Microcoleus sp. FACHB-1515]|uniref:hypothetical protein n=1 Tax=Cyanophyceae TaxID=3028117 RepID=UPI001687CDE3|nr:hypothetical protein [Microcoleus sp. FACHB-1515]MBD2091897.1 hypothetical protein [Microcoleus sp. FACHB-1515]
MAASICGLRSLKLHGYENRNDAFNRATSPIGLIGSANFNTFDPSERENTIVKAELRIGTAGIEVVPTSSIRSISLINDRGEPLQPREYPWWLCDL